MVRNYTPKKSFFDPTRIHKIAKDILKDCGADRERALETFELFKNMVANNPDDDKAKPEIIHALNLSMNANDKIVKILELMVKMTQSEMKSSPPKTETMSFEDLRNIK
tara:strand:+ start:623 stop:946 length:324 start_codon:yes stop_codon:yes gene_type:complete